MSCEAATERCASNAAVEWSFNRNKICYPRDPWNHQFNQSDCGSVSPAFSGRNKLVAPYIISISNVGTNESGTYGCYCPLDLKNPSPSWSIQIKIVGELAYNIKYILQNLAL